MSRWAIAPVIDRLVVLETAASTNGSQKYATSSGGIRRIRPNLSSGEPSYSLNSGESSTQTLKLFVVSLVDPSQVIPIARVVALLRPVGGPPVKNDLCKLGL